MHRIVKKTLEAKKNSLEWHKTLMESEVSEVARGEDSTPGRLRRFYTKTYKSLDQFDQIWYDLCYSKRDKSWSTCYIWSVVLAAIVNSRSAYCEVHQLKEPAKDFSRNLIQEIQDYCFGRMK